MDGRMKCDRVELAYGKDAMATHGVVLRHDVLERSTHIRGEDDVHDVLAVRSRRRRDRVDDRHGPFERNLCTVREESCLLPELPPQALRSKLSPTLTPPPGRSHTSPSALS